MYLQKMQKNTKNKVKIYSRQLNIQTDKMNTVFIAVDKLLVFNSHKDIH